MLVIFSRLTRDDTVRMVSVKAQEKGFCDGMRFGDVIDCVGYGMI